MTTATQASDPKGSSAHRWKSMLPGLALVGWCLGVVGLWWIGRSAGWGPGELVLALAGWLLVLAVAARDAVRNMFGPVFVYEVTRLGRRKLTFILRLAYVCSVLSLLVLMYTDWLDEMGYFTRRSGGTVPSQYLSQFAAKFFYAFLGVQFGVVVFLTPAYVAGSIADEKERKTLEFLLATDLRNREIIFGKLAARVVTLLMFVLAGLPLVAFLQLFGGIDPELLIAGIAATVITILGISSIGVYYSTRLKKPRDAIALTYMTVVAYLAITLMAGAYILSLRLGAGSTVPLLFEDLFTPEQWSDFLDAVGVASDWISAGNPIITLIGMLNPRTGTGFSPAAVGDALGRYALFWGLVTALLIGLSVWKLRYYALEQGPIGRKEKKKRSSKVEEEPRSAPARRPAASSPSRYPAVGRDPMIWKEVFVEGGVRGGCGGFIISILMLGIIFVVPLILFWNNFVDTSGYRGDTFARRWEDFSKGMNIWCRICTGGLGFLIMISVTVRGAGVVSGERDRDTWISLLSTPLTAWEMLRGKWLGTVMGLRRAYFIMFTIWALTLLVGGVDPPMILISLLYLVVYVSAFAWLGVLCSITARTTLIATVRALMIALFLSGGFWLFLGLCCAMPLNIMFRGIDTIFDDIAQILLGWTPPFVLGWMPLRDYESTDLGPFRVSNYRGNMEGIGPFSPVLGLFVWIALGCLFGVMAWQAFVRATNRQRDHLGTKLAKMRKPPEEDD